MNGEKHVELVSTQITLKERLELDSKLPDFYYVISERQFSGRGRGDHEWVSSTGNLHASILLRTLPIEPPTWAPLWVSVCTHRALVKLGADDTRISLKWPNDLWIDGSFKVAGVLCEKKGAEIIAGIGLNLVQSPLVSSGVVPFREDQVAPEAITVLEAIIEEMASLKSLEQLIAHYERHSLFKNGATISWRSNDKVLEGVVLGLGEYGEMLVESEGRKIPLYSEEVSKVIQPATTGQST